MGDYIIGGPDQDPNLQMDPETGKAFLATQRRDEGVRGKGRLPTSLEELRQGLDNRALQQASFTNPSERTGLAGSRPAPTSFAPKAQAAPKTSPEDLLAQAKAMLEMQEIQNSHALHGTAISPRKDDGTQTPAWLSNYMNQKD